MGQVSNDTTRVIPNNGLNTDQRARIDAHITRGRELFGEGRIAEAAKEFREVLTIDINEQRAWNNIAVSMFCLKQWDSAIEAFAHALASDPNNSEIRHNLRTLLMATDNSGRVDANVLVNYGEALYQAGKFGEAHEQFLLALQSDRGNAHAWNNLGVSLFETGQLEGAEQALHHAMEVDAWDSNNRANYAKVLHARGRTQDAEDLLMEGLRRAPLDVELQRTAIALGITDQRTLEQQVHEFEIRQAVAVLAVRAPEKLA